MIWVRLVLAFLFGTLITAVIVRDYYQSRQKLMRWILLDRICGGILLWGGCITIIAALIVPGRFEFLTGGVWLALFGILFLSLGNIKEAIRERGDNAGQISTSHTNEKT